MKLLAPLPFRVTGIYPHTGERGVLDSYHDVDGARRSARRLTDTGYVDVRVEEPEDRPKVGGAAEGG
jgi:hypothetical protein